MTPCTNRISWLNHFKSLLVLPMVLSLLACGAGEQDELKTWMKQARDRTPSSVPKLVPPVMFKPEPYTLASELDPFDAQKLKSALAKARAAAGGSNLQPNLNRRREALEAFPLDAIRFVGYVFKNNKPSALLSVNGGLYTATLGNYVGADYGRVVGLSEREVLLKELIQDGSGEWSERLTRLELLEAAKESKK